MASNYGNVPERVNSDTILWNPDELMNNDAPFFYPGLMPFANPPLLPDLNLDPPEEPDLFDESNNILFDDPLLEINHPIDEMVFNPIPQYNQEEAMDLELIAPPPPAEPHMMLEPLAAEEEIMLPNLDLDLDPDFTHFFDDIFLSALPFVSDLQNTANPHYNFEPSLLECCMCKKVHDLEGDLYMYRDQSFCSVQCRSQKMWLDDHEVKTKETSTAPSTSKVVFFIGHIPKSW